MSNLLLSILHKYQKGRYVTTWRGLFHYIQFLKDSPEYKKKGSGNSKGRSFFSHSDMSKCFLISLASNLAHQKLQIFHFQSQFSMSKLNWIFLKMIFLFQYVNSRITYVNDPFHLLQIWKSLFYKIVPEIVWLRSSWK